MLCSYIMQLFFKFFITNLYVCIYLCHMVDTFTMILYLLFIQVNVLWETCLWKADFMHHNNLSHVVDKFTSFSHKRDCKTTDMGKSVVDKPHTAWLTPEN